MHKKVIIRVVCYILAVLIFLCGLAVYLFPLANRAITNHNIQENLEDFRYVRTVDSDVVNYDESGSNEKDSQTEKSDSDLQKFDELFYAMADYNKKIYEQKQSGLKDAWSYEKAEFDLTKYEIYNNIIGELRIPAMDCDLPLYLGATWNNMAWGAVQLGQTSMPIGGVNTNCVIAAHRGCTNGRYFLDIENMKKGDKVYIDNLWGTLTYEVRNIAIISPDEIDKILIQDGKDMVTLITCHPYPYNYQRYVVYCERTDNDSTSNTGSDNQSATETTILNNDSDIDDTDVDDFDVDDSGNEDDYDKGSQAFINLENILVVGIPVFLILLAVVLFMITSKKRIIKKPPNKSR